MEVDLMISVSLKKSGPCLKTISPNYYITSANGQFINLTHTYTYKYVYVCTLKYDVRKYRNYNNELSYVRFNSCAGSNLSVSNR